MQIDADGVELARTPVGGAWGLATYRGRVYVAQYLSTSTAALNSVGSGVAVLDAADLSLITTLKPPAALARVFNDGDSGYSGVAISPTGTLYVCDQIWKLNTVVSNNPSTYFTPEPVSGTQTASPINDGGRWYFDRVLQRQL